MERLADIIQGAAKARGIEKPGQLRDALAAAGHDVSLQAVIYWWTGQFRPVRHVAELVEVLGLNDQQRMGIYEAEVNPPPPSARPARKRARLAS